MELKTLLPIYNKELRTLKSSLSSITNGFKQLKKSLGITQGERNENIIALSKDILNKAKGNDSLSMPASRNHEKFETLKSSLKILQEGMAGIAINSLEQNNHQDINGLQFLAENLDSTAVQQMKKIRTQYDLLLKILSNSIKDNIFEITKDSIKGTSPEVGIAYCIMQNLESMLKTQFDQQQKKVVLEEGLSRDEILKINNHIKNHVIPTTEGDSSSLFPNNRKTKVAIATVSKKISEFV